MHTLNGTAVTARAMIALMENFQEEDGSVRIPEALHELGAPQKLGPPSASRPSGARRGQFERLPNAGLGCRLRRGAGAVERGGLENR